MDTRTMVLAISLGYGLFGVMLVLFERQRLRSGNLWLLGAAFMLIGTGVMLQLLEADLPVAISVFVGNFISALGLTFQVWGIRQIVGPAVSLRTRLIMVGGLIGVVIVAAFVPQPGLSALGSALYASLYGASAFLLLHWDRRSRLALFLGAAMTLVAIMFGARGVANLTDAGQVGAFARGGWYIGTYAILYLTMLVSGFGLLLLTKERADEQLRDAHREMTTMLAILPTGVLMVGNGIVVRANPASESLFGYPSNGLIGAPVSSLLSGLPNPDSHHLNTELVATRLDGTTYWTRVLANPVTGGEEVDSIMSITEITDLKQLQANLELQAMHDDLTGLCNRRAFLLRGTHEIDVSRETGRPLCLALLDMDRLKEINDRLGHGAGDDGLRKVAEACQAFADADLAARFGGDEFALLLPGHDQRSAENRCAAIHARLSGVTVSDGSATLPVTVSIGVAPMREADSLEDLLQRADQAMYASKMQRHKGG